MPSSKVRSTAKSVPGPARTFAAFATSITWLRGSIVKAFAALPPAVQTKAAASAAASVACTLMVSPVRALLTGACAARTCVGHGT